MAMIAETRSRSKALRTSIDSSNDEFSSKSPAVTAPLKNTRAQSKVDPILLCCYFCRMELQKAVGPCGRCCFMHTGDGKYITINGIENPSCVGPMAQLLVNKKEINRRISTASIHSLEDYHRSIDDLQFDLDIDMNNIIEGMDAVDEELGEHFKDKKNQNHTRLSVTTNVDHIIHNNSNSNNNSTSNISIELNSK
eukprot:Awhi_evm1s3776